MTQKWEVIDPNTGFVMINADRVAFWSRTLGRTHRAAALIMAQKGGGVASVEVCASLSLLDWISLQQGRSPYLHCGKARLTVEGDSYRMMGPTGTHELPVEGTSKARLSAHWTGFLGNQ
jgi:hypothetical protein